MFIPGFKRLVVSVESINGIILKNEEIPVMCMESIMIFKFPTC